MSNGNSSGEKRGDAGGKGGGNRRRYFRRRKPAAAKTQEAAPKPAPRKAAEPSAKGRPRNNGKNEGAGRNDRDRDRDRRGGRRRRRRSRNERPEDTPVVRESTLAAIDQEYKPPKSVFVYTYVLRPGAPSSHEFRAEHFSRVGRRLEDFDIDLSPIFPVEGKAKPDPSPRLPMDLDEEGRGKFSDEIDEVGDFDQINGEEEGVEL